MKIEKRDSNIERRILTAFIVDNVFLGTIASKWDGEMFRSKWCNLIGSWCVKHFEKYQKAPNKAIVGLYESWAERAKDTSTVKLIEKFLTSLSDQYKSLAREINTDYILDQASIYFNEVKVEKFKEALEEDLESKDLQKAFKRIDKFSKVEVGVGSGINVLQDDNALKAVFKRKRTPLIKYKGALGNFFGDSLEREGFILVEGPEKRGKTYVLLDLAWTAMKQSRKVAFFEIGDLSQDQIMERFTVRASRRPYKARKIKYPKDITREPDSELANVEHDIITYTKPLNLQTARKAMKRLVKSSGSNEPLLKLSVHPNDSLSVAGVISILQSWERIGWVPDVIVIDYADLLMPPSGMQDGRDAINHNFKKLRSISQIYHCLTITASQASAKSYTAHTMSITHFSEDKRKRAHTTGTFGLSQTEEEKKDGVMRLNWLALRGEEFTEKKCVYVAGCLSIANPFIKSTF